MFKKSIIARIISFSIFMTVIFLFTTAVAIQFPDIQDKNWDWARSNIEEMASKQIIMGFPDGTFKPAENVTKLQSLILVSRIVGFSEEINKEYIEAAKDVYMSKLKSYNISNKEEISYLLYKNVISVDELDSYISDENFDKPLKRYEAAILFTKALGMEDDVKGELVPLLVYIDQDDIPAYARPYVKFVRDYGIMKGIDETGPEFGPTLNVSRAQMAVMLYRVIERNKKDISIETGTVASVSVAGSILEIKDDVNETKEYDISDDILLIVDGIKTDLSDVKKGMSVILSFRNDNLYMVEALTPPNERSFIGVITRITNVGGSRTLTLTFDENGSQVTRDYTLADDANVFDANGKLVGAVGLKTQQFAKFTLSGNKIIKIEIEEKTQTVSGVIENITLQPLLEIEVKTKAGETQKYRVDDKVIVYKNNRSSDMNSVRVGDDVILTLEYGVITKVDAKGSQSTAKGTLEEILISRTPSIKVNVNNNIVEYSVARDVIIRIDGKEASIYDLRLGYPVSLKMDSNSVTEITANTVVESHSITGVVQRVNVAVNLINVLTTDATGKSVERMVFVKNNTNIINNKTGGKLSLSSIKEGDTIIATGETTRGDFEAITILVISE